MNNNYVELEIKIINDDGTITHEYWDRDKYFEFCTWPDTGHHPPLYPEAVVIEYPEKNPIFLS